MMLATLSRTRMVQMPRTILAATTKPLTLLSVRCFVTNDDGRGFATRVMREEADKGQPLMRKVPNHLQRLEEGDLMKVLQRHQMHDFQDIAHNDCTLVGSGITNLVCLYKMLELGNFQNFRIALFEKANQLGPGAPLTSIILRKPAETILYDLGLKDFCQEHNNFVLIPHAEVLKNALVHKIFELSHARKIVLKIFCGIEVDNLLLRHSEFSPVRGLTAMRAGETDPSIFINTNLVISSCGDVMASPSHTPNSFQKGVRRMNDYAWSRESSEYFYLDTTHDINWSEDAIVHFTREVSPGLICGGSELSWLDSLPKIARASCGGCVLSGLKAANIALEVIKRNREEHDTETVGYETASHFMPSD